jgi:hypothetical protein
MLIFRDYQSITYFLFSYTLCLVIFEHVELPHNYFSVIGRFVTGGLPNDFLESVLRAIAESYKGLISNFALKAKSSFSMHHNIYIFFANCQSIQQKMLQLLKN